MKNLFILSFIVLMFTACSTEAIKPEFERLEKIQITSLTKNNVSISADAILYNPNPISIFLTQVEIDVFANDIEVTHISQTEETEITKKDEFPIPLSASFNPKDLFRDNLIGMIQSGLDMFKDKNVNMRYEGYIKVKVMDVEFEVPIDMEEKIALEKAE